MSESVAAALVNNIPAVLWVAFAALAYVGLRKAILPQIGRLSSVKAGLVELSFAYKLLDDQAGADDGAAERQVLSARDRRAAVSRLEHAAEVLKEGQILWVDDNPEWNRPLLTLFDNMGMKVHVARSTEEAMGQLRRHSFDLLVTDMRRETESPSATAGLTLIERLHQLGAHVPIVIFAGQFDPQRGVHPSVFGYTNDATDLVHLVIDVMERVKFGAAV